MIDHLCFQEKSLLKYTINRLSDLKLEKIFMIREMYILLLYTLAELFPVFLIISTSMRRN